MNVKKFIHLISETAKNKDNFKEGAVSFNGYGFIFRDLGSNIPYITSLGSSKVFGAGSHRDFTKTFRRLSKNGHLRNFDQCLATSPEFDLLLAGSVKTLVPSLKFGGYEQLFDVWMFVQTPEVRRFPATFYYGQSGLSIGGWEELFEYYTKESFFPKEFEELINYSPIDFVDFERNEFLDALEFALKKVPVSDFSGIYQHDLGNTFMGIVDGEPLIRELSDKIQKKRNDNTIYDFRTGKSFKWF